MLRKPGGPKRKHLEEIHQFHQCTWVARHRCQQNEARDSLEEARASAHSRADRDVVSTRKGPTGAVRAWCGEISIARASSTCLHLASWRHALHPSLTQVDRAYLFRPPWKDRVAWLSKHVECIRQSTLRCNREGDGQGSAERLGWMNAARRQPREHPARAGFAAGHTCDRTGRAAKRKGASAARRLA